jgi:oligoribonuclease (3'-5' exoribonuclease)
VLAAAPAKTSTHRALEDIRESVVELRYYRSVAFRPDGDGSGASAPSSAPAAPGR